MPAEVDTLSRVVVFASAAAYWAGVFVEARRIRRRIGRSANVRPRGRKEKLLWLGWCLVTGLWLSLPFLAGRNLGAPGLEWIPFLRPAPATVAGLVQIGAALLLVGVGHAGTYWCYHAMGDTWRMGINRQEKNRLVTHGPYRRVRHPIYLFQIVLLSGATLLLPAPISFFMLGLHLVCATIKATDEEAYLLGVHGEAYRIILDRTGRFLPKWRALSLARERT